MRNGLRLLALGFALAALGARAAEDDDFGVAAAADLRLAEVHAPTPREIPGARVILTRELQERLRGAPERRPLLFDVLGGGNHESIPGAVWLPGAGRGESLGDALQARLARTLKSATRGDATRPMVFFCQGNHCWLSYNAALRAAALGYREVYWYRGGLEAWLAAGGEVARLDRGWRRPAP